MENPAWPQLKGKGGLGKLFRTWLIYEVDGGDTKPLAVATREPTAKVEFVAGWDTVFMERPQHSFRADTTEGTLLP